jgi:transcriptional regulator with XRE-family HTH domain
MEIKDKLKNRRIDLGLTLKQVANATGVSEGTISRWESGEIENMRRCKISLYAKVLQLSPLDIIEDSISCSNDERPAPMKFLSYDDRELLEAYGAASPDTQAAVRAVLGLSLKKDAHILDA